MKLWLDASNPSSYPGSGTTWYDLSGNNNNGTMNNGVVPLSNAMQFDGVNDYVITSQVLNIAKVTMSVWVNIPQAITAKGFSLGFQNGVNGTATDKYFYIDSNMKPYFYVFDGNPKTTSIPESPISANTWFNAVCIADGIKAKLYINNIEVGSISAAGTYTGYNVPNILIGGNSTAIGYMYQKLNDIFIYNRALTANEVLQNYNATKSKY